jgi:hypothetical protein
MSQFLDHRLEPDILIQRSTAVSLNSARIIGRSIETIMRSIAIALSAARARERASIIRAESLGTRTRLARHAAKPAAASRIDHIHRLPLTSPMLLECAEEYRALARSAATPEIRAAFEDLVFCYTARAAGYDNERIGSKMLH